MVTDGVPTLSEQCVQEKQDRIAHANDKVCGKNSAQDLYPREAFPLHSSVWLLTYRSFVEQTMGFSALPREGIYTIYNNNQG